MANEIYLNADGSLDSAITDLFAAADYVTISSGAITVTKSAAQVDTQSSAATDDLDTITMASIEDGKVLFIRSAAVGRTVVLKHLTGNIYNSGGDVRLTTPEQLAMLVYSGSKWVVVACGCGGSGDMVPPIDEEDVEVGNEVPCVAVARMVEYLEYIINAAKAKIENTRLEIVEALAGTIAIVQPAYSAPAVMALAAALDTNYADAAAVDAVFDSAFYAAVQGILYCADADDDGVISAAELETVYSELAILGTDETDIITSLIGILGATGLSNAVGVSVTDAGTCTGCYKCVGSASELITFDVSQQSRCAFQQVFLPTSQQSSMGFDASAGVDGGYCAVGYHYTTNPADVRINACSVRITEPISGAWDGGILSVKFQCMFTNIPGFNAGNQCNYFIQLLDSGLAELARADFGGTGETPDTWNTISHTFNYTSDVAWVRVAASSFLGFGDKAPQPIKIDNVCIVKQP